jgi:hypothetical protein
VSSAGDQPVAVLDAVCCVQFCAARRHRLLLTLLVELGWEIYIPGEVDAEVRGKKRQYADLAESWQRFTVSDRVHVLDVIELSRPDQAAVRDTVARLRGTTAALALGMRNHLGEHIVVGHATVLRDAGRDVTVLIDDGDAQQLAEDEGLQVVDMESLLLFGHRRGLADLDTKVKVKRVYESLLPFGGSLVPWASCWLRTQL